MSNAVHLEGLRCDGSAHDGCQAGCLLFWKEAWLERVRGPEASGELPGTAAKTPASTGSSGSGCDLAALTRATRAPTAAGGDGKEPYRCQATDMLQATTPIGRWDFGHYAKDLTSRNVRLRDFVRYAPVRAFIAAVQYVTRLHWRGRRSAVSNSARACWGEDSVEVLNLTAGELVRVRSKAEIMRTINAKQQNRGLYYDEEMLLYCNKVHRVLKRVERIIDERTGKMISIPGGCIILDGVVCSGNHSSNRLFCPRSIYPYWREIWLKRVESTANPLAGREEP